MVDHRFTFCEGTKALNNKAYCCEKAETKVTHCNSPARSREGKMDEAGGVLKYLKYWDLLFSDSWSKVCWPEISSDGLSPNITVLLALYQRISCHHWLTRVCPALLCGWTWPTTYQIWGGQWDLRGGQGQMVLEEVSGVHEGSPAERQRAKLKIVAVIVLLFSMSL